ncbi:MAG TPA: hypothetical protein VFN30_00825 [Chitinophagaceae bacterium]|nr:hypothetical protein [Chitinophagaceae bacterium]
MTTRRTVDSRVGTLKTMSGKKAKPVVVKLFAFAAAGLMAVSIMSFAQKNDSMVKENLLSIATAKTAEPDGCCDNVTTYAVYSTIDKNGYAKVVLSEAFVNSLRNIKLEVSQADREVANDLYFTKMADKMALNLIKNSQFAIEEANVEIEEKMEMESIKYSFFSGNAAALNEASAEVEQHMQEASLKQAFESATESDMTDADKEIAGGLQKKLSENLAVDFIKGASKNIADADMEIAEIINLEIAQTINLNSSVTLEN